MGIKFFTKKSSKFLIVAIICFGLIFLNPKGFFNPLKVVAFKLAYPFQKTFYLTGKSVNRYFGFLGKLAEIKKENESLIKENYILQGEFRKLKTQKKENEVLRSQLNLIPQDKFDLEASFVIGQDLQGLSSWIMLDKGKKNGIKPGMAVIFSQGILVGKVEEVFSSTSKVSLISDAESVINAFDLETGAKGVLKGEYGLGIILDMISQKEVLNVGDAVMTSGLGSDMPKGLLIGKIQEVRSSVDRLFQQAIIKPSVKSQSLEVVFVIKN